MVSIDVISETPMSMSHLKDELKKIKERDGELNFRANKTEEFLNSYVQLDADKTSELKKKLEDLNIPRLKEDHIIKIVDLMPLNADEVKSILQGYTLTVTKDNLKKIAAAVAEFAPQKK